jgi:hypothetical protein
MVSRGSMKKRFLYSILFGIPGFFISLIVSFVIFGVAVGILWIYVFGDNPWPSSTEKILPILFALIFLTVWIASIAAGYVTGKKLESDPALNKTHILVSGGLTIMFILFIALQQLSVGNIGPKSEDALCSEFCNQQGYSGSGMPPRNSGERTCSCFDNSGREVLKVPLDNIDSDTSK